LTKSLAARSRPSYPCRWSISPGLVETDFIKSMDQRWRDEQFGTHAAEGLTSPNEVAAAVVVAVKNLTFTTGSIIAIDGGRPAKLNSVLRTLILARSSRARTHVDEVM